VRIVSVGGGPAGLYFAILMKKADPAHDITVLERNRADDTFGFGVVFSDATLESFAQADLETHDAIAAALARWDDIDIHYQGQVVTCGGHGFSGLARQRLLDILQARCRALGVRLAFQHEVGALEPWLDADLILAADGVNSTVRQRYAQHFAPRIDWRPNRFVWLGTTCPFPAFTFIFKADAHGLWRVHAYRYDTRHSTFILETTEATWRRAGLDAASEDETVAFAERLFAGELGGHRMLKNRSLWRNFPTVHNARWHWERVVLIGDAAHTAHFSIGSGTKLAMEDAIALSGALAGAGGVEAALAAYEAERRPQVEAIQRAAQVSLEWFEHAERYAGRLEPLQFAFSLLTRSLRVTHQSLRVRDAKFVETVDRWFAARAADQSGERAPIQPAVNPRAPIPTAPPPMFAPLRLRDLRLANRVVAAPVCPHAAEDGCPNDWHLVSLGSRALGGAGLVMAEMTAVSRTGRLGPGAPGMYRPGHVAAWARIVEFVHAHTGARIALQLAHAGRKGATRGPGEDATGVGGDWPLVSASPLPYLADGQVPRAMDRADMDEILGQFVQATRMAEAAGFDMLELQMGHGFLLASFISPLTNRREDGYGGPLAHRLRYPLQVLDAVRAAWPAARPLSVMISATDWAEGGLTGEDAVEIARALKAHGCDIVTVATGQTVSQEQPTGGRVSPTTFSDRLRQEADIATMTVGVRPSWAVINSVLAAGRADLCVLASEPRDDPYWTRLAAWEQGWVLAGPVAMAAPGSPPG
jgi:anthraniloyl-CoA monooxygenase